RQALTEVLQLGLRRVMDTPIGEEGATSSPEQGRRHQAGYAAGDQPERAPGEQRRKGPGDHAPWVVNGRSVVLVNAKHGCIEHRNVRSTQAGRERAVDVPGAMLPRKAHQQRSDAAMVWTPGVGGVIRRRARWCRV